jgi:UDP-N-acetylglucosamine 4,6-dehydratase
MAMDFSDKTILITGGTGSFGRKFAEIVQRDYRPRKLIIFSRDELKQHDMRLAGFDQPNMRYFIGDVRDKDRLYRAFVDVDIVVHAAALKQVPACEYNPIEAIATNIIGARNVIDAAIDRGVERVLAMSTDKATAPINLYGATKLVAEKLFIQGNAYSGGEGTRFSVVRYGNVVGSRGSVVPVFKEQARNGKLTITDQRMTRFWITLEQGVRFVISCIDMMYGGEIFIPKLPSMNIMDLARLIEPDARIEFIGIRPGEKLHESMITRDEARQAVEIEDRYIILPAHPWWNQKYWERAKPLPDDFEYSSDRNERWLTEAEMRQMIETYEA